MKKSIFTVFRHGAAAALIAVSLAGLGLFAPQGVSAASNQGTLRILATTYPVYLLARNVVQNRPGAQVDLLIPAQTGCPHDYALTPKDMQKLAQADVLLLNGLGLDDFMQKALPNAKPGLVVVDSSTGITPVMEADGEEDEHQEASDAHGGHDHAAVSHEHEEGEHDHAHEHGHVHDHGGVNPHAFASPVQAGIMVKNMADGLAKADPQHAATYEANAQAYGKVLANLGERLSTLGNKSSNKGIALMHDALVYMARDGGLEVVAVIQENEEAQPSAARLLKVAEVLREHKPALIASEPQYSDKAVQTLSREVGIPSAQLDSLASGPANPSLDHYEKTMNNNINILEKYFEQR
ncbi:MAG: zinc ABC transporter substrate-binding protein [Desulfovibrio sp.]|uniref:metal ABC transporter substrate-binding protein n=1 Tax=Desulfovibrio sp. TaxID=885 RepID=UPI0039E35FB3